MESFTFSSPLLPTPLTITQQPTGVIGCKLYPGALLMIRALEGGCAPFPTPRAGDVVIELGAGVCGLPSLVLGGVGVTVLATDLPALLPPLSVNIASNGLSHAVTPTPLPWGDAAAAAAVRDAADTLLAAASLHHPGAKLWVVAADVVYHEELISPLLATLVALTSRPPAPTVLLAYVHRFKRARAFFKLARKQFVLVETQGGRVFDYHALNVTQVGGGGALTSGSAVFVEGAAAAPAEGPVERGAGGGSDSEGGVGGGGGDVEDSPKKASLFVMTRR